MISRIPKALAAMAIAAGLVVGTAAPAFAVTVYTGAKSCPTSSYAFTNGVAYPGNSIKHYQLIGSTWWASPTWSNWEGYPKRTTWQYSTSNHYFSNSYIYTTIDAAGNAYAGCA